MNTCVNALTDAQMDVGLRRTEPTSSFLTMTAAGDLRG